MASARAPGHLCYDDDRAAFLRERFASTITTMSFGQAQSRDGKYARPYKLTRQRNARARKRSR